MENPEITFLMIVTDYDAIVANYSIPSLQKLTNIPPFRLRVFMNNLSGANKQKYVDRWQAFPYVELVDGRPTQADRETFIEGPYEHCCTVWERELRKLDTPYVATIDADFEILEPDFVRVMLRRLQEDSQLVGMSADYTATEEYFDTYSNQMMIGMEQWNTWFIIYKREAFECPRTLSMHKETSADGKMMFWDSTGWFQEALQERGHRLAVVDASFQPQFIHYGAFSKNLTITERNVALFRFLNIRKKRGLFGRGDLLGCYLARRASNWLFREANTERDSLLPGYTGQWPEGVDTYP